MVARAVNRALEVAFRLAVNTSSCCIAGVNYLVSERVVVPSTEGCCKTGGSEHHADDQVELHLCDSEVGLF